MVKPLSFKGDKKVKKRKRAADADDAEPSSKTLTTSAHADEEHDDSWVNADAPSDISGPIVITLPTEKLTCLACDAVGKVFASELENVVDGDATTAEPHDVRQVFVANKVAGTEDFNLKGHHGRYVRSNCATHVYMLTSLKVSELRQVRHPQRQCDRHIPRRTLPHNRDTRQSWHLLSTNPA